MTGDLGSCLAIILAVSVEQFYSSVDSGHGPLSRLFLRYVTPTVAAMLVTGVYVTIDGIFVRPSPGPGRSGWYDAGLPHLRQCSMRWGADLYRGLVARPFLSGHLDEGAATVGNALVMVLIASVLLAFTGIRHGREMLT